MPKIALVEDDAMMLSLLTTLLEIEGFQVIRAKDDTLDGILSSLRSQAPDLALIDVHLRQTSGFDLLRQIRGDDSIKNMRILMSSGMDFRERCQQEGADGFILKPYMPDELIKLIRQSIKA